MSSEAAISIGSLIVMLGLGVIALLLFAFWLWMLVHAITNKGLSDVEKLIWVLVLLFVPILGPILYFFIGRPKNRTLLRT